MALLLLLLIPFVWGSPLGLVCAELSSALPQEGGYYVMDRAWARALLGGSSRDGG